MIQIDNFLGSYKELKEYAKTADFRDIVNPVDGVVYPHICDSIPAHIRSEILGRIEFLIGREPENVTLFMRRSPKGVHCPHIVHTDNSMGSHSLMLYMDDNENAGTAFLKHIETAMNCAPTYENLLKIAINDQNNIKKWETVEMCQMKQNRACLFDSSQFHCAMPIGGFGDGAEARTVLTVFFS